MVKFQKIVDGTVVKECCNPLVLFAWEEAATRLYEKYKIEESSVIDTVARKLYEYLLTNEDAMNYDEIDKIVESEFKGIITKDVPGEILKLLQNCKLDVSVYLSITTTSVITTYYANNISGLEGKEVEVFQITYNTLTKSFAISYVETSVIKSSMLLKIVDLIEKQKD